MKVPKAITRVAEMVDATFAAHGVKLTLGGEPTCVPIDPQGSEWSITALGPTKLRYARALARSLIAQTLPKAVPVFSPGKYYPGEANPRWAINLVWNRDASPLVPALAKPLAKGRKVTEKSLAAFAKNLLTRLGLASGWLGAIDPADTARPVHVLPLDHTAGGFITEDWQVKGGSLDLLWAEGPAGLRLPLNSLPEQTNRRALTIEIVDDALHIFLPPLLQSSWLKLVELIIEALRDTKLAAVEFSGYVPSDEAHRWTRLAIAADPGVLEINLPPCATWHEYAHWMHALEDACASAGLRSFKQIAPDEQTGTGGGNHLLFGGPTLETNPLFTHPAWVTSMLRYWQHHPSLAYLFTGQYVGPSSQAPRPDECVSSLYDLEMAYRFLEQLDTGDHRYLISETLRHLHTDASGNTHRSESSFDKFWNANFDGGCRGLIEFRAVESLPHAEWMSAVALLWHTLAAFLLEHPFSEPLIDFGEELHDRFFLPDWLWADFERVLRELHRAGFPLPSKTYREIFEWRFPILLEHSAGDSTLAIRRAHESWPLLCEQPLEGGSTSRFVDTSIERLEFLASNDFAASSQIHVNGRELPLQRFPGNRAGAGIRYRRSALYPSLHPGIAPQLPLHVSITGAAGPRLYTLEIGSRHFTRKAARHTPVIRPSPCKKLHPELLTYDLRLP
jgi:uncharacterized protein (DUF2126 family)